MVGDTDTSDTVFSRDEMLESFVSGSCDNISRDN